MSYQIHYSVKRKRLPGKMIRDRLLALTALFFCVFLILVGALWPEGIALIKRGIPVSALDQFASELLNGESVKTSLLGLISTITHDPV